MPFIARRPQPGQQKAKSCRDSRSIGIRSPPALPPHGQCSRGSPGAGGMRVPRMGRAGCGAGHGVLWGHGVPWPWPWARGAACARLGSFCRGTSFDINIFLLSTRPTFQTMPLASRLPHSSSAVLPQPAPQQHPRRRCTPGHGAATQDGHSPRWHHGDPRAGARGQLAALSPVGGSCCLVPAPAMALQGVAGSPLGFLHPIPERAQLCRPFPPPPALFPGTVHALAGKQPHPGTALSRDSPLGDILLWSGRSVVKRAAAKRWLWAGPWAVCGDRGPP